MLWAATVGANRAAAAAPAPDQIGVTPVGISDGEGSLGENVSGSGRI